MEEPDWDALLPNRRWKKFGERSWKELMPPRRDQLSHLLPRNFEGSCTIHACSESFTVFLRRLYGTTKIAVDLPRFLHLATEKGILTATGSTLAGVNRLVSIYGLPVSGYGADVYAMGTSVITCKAKPMPFTNPTPEEAEEAMIYREVLCEMLNAAPVVLCYYLQKHYNNQRAPGEAYCAMEGKEHFITKPRSWLQWLSFADAPMVSHAVTAYAYTCPGGDVRSLKLICQENMRGSANEELIIHPDAVRSYTLTNVVDARLRKMPELV